VIELTAWIAWKAGWVKDRDYRQWQHERYLKRSRSTVLMMKANR
jgi:hypothetical protein